MNAGSQNQVTGQLLDKLMKEYIWGPQENISFVSEVKELQKNGMPESRILLITYGAIYIFKMRNLSPNDYVLEIKYNLVNVERISYIQPNIVTFLIKDNKSNGLPCTLQSENALDIAKLILYLNKICKYNIVDLDKIGQPLIESSPPNALVSPTILTRPKNALQIRILQFAHMNDQRFPIDQLKLISEWDKNPQSVLKLTNVFNCGQAANAVATAIVWDPEIKCLILDNFVSSQLHNVLKTITSESKTLIRLSVDNYNTPTNEKYELPAPITSKIIELSFRNCHSSVLFSLLNGMNNFMGRLKIFTISKTRLLCDEIQRFFEIFNQLSCFCSLTTLKIEDGAADNLMMDDLANFLPQVKIRSLHISRTNKDIADLAKCIFDNTSTIHMLYLSGCKLFKRVTVDQINLPICLSYLDLSKSSMSPAALQAFLMALFSQSRDTLLTLNLSDLKSNISTESLVKCFNIPSPQPILSELIFAGNILLPEDVSDLFDFLRTQTRLCYLNLACCFVEKVDESLKIVSEFIIETKLKGIDLSSPPSAPYKQSMTNFIKSLSNANATATAMANAKSATINQGQKNSYQPENQSNNGKDSEQTPDGATCLNTLIIEKSAMGDDGLNALKQFVEYDKNLTELNCDGSRPQTTEAFKNAYIVFSKVERVAPPKYDLAFLSKKQQQTQEGSAKQQKNTTMSPMQKQQLQQFQGTLIPIGFAAKLPPKTLQMRVNDYESLAGVQSPIQQPMDALINIMSLMTQSIKGIGPDVIQKKDLISAFHESIMTSAIPLKPQSSLSSGTNLLFSVLAPTLQVNNSSNTETASYNSTFMTSF